MREPRMRCAAARLSASHILIRLIAWRRSAVINDDGRSVITAAECNPRDVKFGFAISGEIFAGFAARSLAPSSIVLDFRHGPEVADGVGKCSCESCIAIRDRLALGFVCIEETSTC